MAFTRKNQLLALCLGTVLVFFAQSMMCFAKEIGILPCCVQVEQHQSAGGDHQQSPSSSDYCCACFLGTIMPAEGTDLSCETSSVTVSVRPDDAAPDSPVYEIEYPPQLS